jgi:hypothetical protein
MDALVKILKWEKFNPRKDVKRPHWFALDNDLVEDDSFFSFNHGEFKTWIYLLSKASKKQNPEIEVFFDAAFRKANISKDDFISALEKLEQNGAVKVTRTESVRVRTGVSEPPYVDVKNPYATLHNNTLHNNTLQNNTLQNTTGSSEVCASPPAKKAVSEIWASYSIAYLTRYKTEPTRNAKVNGQLAHFVKRVPIAEAPEIASFYLSHNGFRYVQAGHSVSLLLMDAEKLRTEWLTGRKITTTDAKNAEFGDSLKNQLQRLGGAS